MTIGLSKPYLAYNAALCDSLSFSSLKGEPGISCIRMKRISVIASSVNTADIEIQYTGKYQITLCAAGGADIKYNLNTSSTFPVTEAILIVLVLEL